MHSFNFKKLLFTAFMVVLSASMVFCSGCATTVNTTTATPSASPAKPSASQVNSVNQEMIIVSDRQFNTGMQPSGFGGTSRGSPCPLIYEGLITMGMDGIKGPSLAESWEVSADGKQWTFHLRKGVKFHDGSDFTSADVKFNGDYYGKYGVSMWWQGYQRVDCPDDYTAIIVFDRPRFSFNSEAALTENFIMSKNTLVGEKGAVGKAIGTGPFKVASVNDQELVLERNNAYWGNKAKLERVIVKVITDPETQAMALESGQVDAIQCYMKVNIIPRLKANSKLKISSTLSINGGAFMMNALKAPFDDISVRKAVNYAIDRDTIVNTLLSGSVEKSQYMLSPAFGEFVNKDVKNYPYDINQAKKLLANAGWKDQNGDGYLEKDGKTLAIKINFDVNTADNPRIAEFLQNEFSKIGMKVTLTPIEYALLEKARTSGEYDALLLYTPNVPHDEPTTHYRNVYSSMSSAYHLLNNKEVDDLVQRLDNTGDHQQRINLHYQLQNILMDQSAVAYLFDYYMIIVAQKSVQDIQAPVHSRWHWASLSKAYIQ